MIMQNRTITLKKDFRNVCLLFLFAIILSGCNNNKSHYAGPLSPEESMKTFHFAENFKAEVFASEPYIIDPVTMEFDEQGNAYVVGMLDANKPDSVRGKGYIYILKDNDGDRRADTSIIFADQLREATSILPWDGGLLVAAGGIIYYYKDTDGDGHEDSKEVLFSGFFNKSEEYQISNLRFGVDNWIYANNFGQVGEVSFSRAPNAPKLQMEGSDFRFRLDRNQFELTTGRGQFGLALDDWGHRFVTENTVHIRQVVIPKRYVDRNPFLPDSLKSAIANISDHDLLTYQMSDAPYWRVERTKQRNKKFQENHLSRVEYARDHFTAASGATFYGGDQFTKEYYGSIFTGDVAGNLVHRDVLSHSDTTPFFIAKRGNQEQSKEFMASTDMWFRPASFTTGPDGNLYVIDMYRQHIEGTSFIPDELKVDMDFNAGNKYGRIYRIVPGNASEYQKVSPDLRNTKSIDLVPLLSHQNQWWRLTAQRLLLERQDKSVIPEVKKLFNQSEDPRFRLHALYVLEGMNALDAEIVIKGMNDSSPGVRENAVILSERFPACLPQLEQMIHDSSIRVAFQVALSLGEFKDKTVIPAMTNIIEQRGESAWFQTAVLSSEAGSSIALLKELNRKDSFFNVIVPWKVTFLENFSNIIGKWNQKEQIVDLLEIISEPPISTIAGWQSASVRGLLKGLGKSEGSGASIKERLKSIEAESGNDIQQAIRDLKQVFSNS